MSDVLTRIRQLWVGHQELLLRFMADKDNLLAVENLVALVTLCYQYQNPGVVYACGNGGSHACALHFAEELTGRFRENRKPLGAVALGEATHLTCVANDFGFSEVFARQLEAFGKKNDVLIAMSTSGNSENVIRAVEAARVKGIYTVGLLGGNGGKLADMVDLPIVVSSTNTARVQEVHMFLLHVLVELVEQKLAAPGGTSPQGSTSVLNFVQGRA